MVVSNASRWSASCCARVRSEKQNASDLDYSVVSAIPDTDTCSLPARPAYSALNCLHPPSSPCACARPPPAPKHSLLFYGGLRIMQEGTDCQVFPQQT